ncbi:MAG: phospho-sugar mutase [Acidimicrobiales bacterium]
MTSTEDGAASRARAWLQADPDRETRAETEALLADGGPALADRFSGHLRFGTAGLRAPMAAGPNRTNRVVARLTAAALADVLAPGALVVVGHDARHRSDVFAADLAGVLAAAGCEVRLLAGPVPTPLLAFGVRHLGTAAGVMVTASHNPPADNGIKVYGADGVQIVGPLDARIAEGLAADPRGLPAPVAVQPTSVDDLVGAYLDAAMATTRPEAVAAEARARLRVAYTPLHGVGGRLALAALRRAGIHDVHVVAAQVEPDGAFPTIASPNPEDPAALAAVLALGRSIGAHVALAHDPDADRLAVAVPTRDGDGMRVLSGDEVGALVGEHLLAAGDASAGDDRLVVSTYAGSRLLARIAAAHGARHVETPPGFKWVMRVVLDHPELRFVFGYEEALGYAIGDRVRDKDGITAAVAVATLVAELVAAGRHVDDELDRLARRHGLHATASHAVVVAGDPAAVPSALAASPPATLGGQRVVAVDDPAPPGTPAGVAVQIGLADSSRVVVRPSGTEPKLKCYLEVVRPVGPGADALAAARADAEARLAATWRDLAATLGLASTGDGAGVHRRPEPDR